MRLTQTDFLPDVQCPQCGVEFDVEPGLENCECQCYGTVECPSCSVYLSINVNVVFTATVVSNE